MIFPSEVPQDWITEAHLNKGVLAGGCLRDLLLNKTPVKDVDIFVRGLTEKECDFDNYVKGQSPVKSYTKNGVAYQIIKHRFDDPAKLINHFDIGLCKIAYHNGIWLLDQDFMNDVINGTLTICLENNSHAKHLASVAARYPDYRVVRLENEFDDLHL